MLMAAIAVFGLSNVNAQEVEKTYGFDAGDVILGGGVGINTTKNKNFDTKSTEFSINPKVGYFINDDFAVGVQGSFTTGTATKNTAGVISDSKDLKSYGAGVFARYYFLDLGKRFKTYTELGLGYESLNDKITDTKADGFGAGLNLGINYFVNKNIAISFGLADILSYSSAKVEGGKSVSGFNGNLNVFNNFFETAQFGVLFVL